MRWIPYSPSPSPVLSCSWSGPVPTVSLSLPVRPLTVLLPLRQDELREGTVGLQEVSVEEILEAQRQVQEARHQQEQLRVKAMKERGLTYTADLGPDDMY